MPRLYATDRASKRSVATISRGPIGSRQGEQISLDPYISALYGAIYDSADWRMGARLGWCQSKDYWAIPPAGTPVAVAPRKCEFAEHACMHACMHGA